MPLPGQDVSPVTVRWENVYYLVNIYQIVNIVIKVNFVLSVTFTFQLHLNQLTNILYDHMFYCVELRLCFLGTDFKTNHMKFTKVLVKHKHLLGLCNFSLSNNVFPQTPMFWLQELNLYCRHARFY